MGRVGAVVGTPLGVGVGVIVVPFEGATVRSAVGMVDGAGDGLCVGIAVGANDL